MDTIVTFTSNGLDKILERQEDYEWVLNESRAKSCKYLVCCHSQGEKRRSAFLVGKIKGIRFVRGDGSNSDKKRWAIQFSEWASVDVPETWGGWQNPVHYTSLKDIGINLSDLKFQKLSGSNSGILPLTIAQAKSGLALHYDVSPENIEILIKG